MGLTHDLSRFLAAQLVHFDQALIELQAGRKRTHWIWFICPQLAGLGSSPMAQVYGIQGTPEAIDYLRHRLLRSRLLAVAHVVATSAVPLRELMGSDIDARKIVSSMTLFAEIARRVDAVLPHPDYEKLAADAETILRTAEAQGIPPCQFTRAALADGR